MSASGARGPEAVRSARLLSRVEIVLWLALVALAACVLFAMIRALRISADPDTQQIGSAPIPGLVEAEDLPRQTSRAFGFWLQPTELPGGWSQGSHMFASGTVEGDWVE